MSAGCSQWSIFSLKIGYSWYAPQSSVLSPFFFLIYISGLRLGLTANVKLFAYDTSLLSVVNNASASAYRLNNDLVKIRDWAFNWKRSFNPNTTKQTKGVIFSKKKKF